MRFTTTIELGGKTATGFRVPADIVAALGKGKKPPVTVTINGQVRTPPFSQGQFRYLGLPG